MLASALVVTAIVLIPVLYRVWFHPLSHVPGPLVAKISSLPLYIVCYIGIEASLLRYYHEKYKTKVLRVAPNSVSISTFESIRDIYVAGGGFPKDDRYKNLDMGPIASIFSARDTEYRDLRAKAVAPLFAPAQVRSEGGPTGVIGSCVAEFVDQLTELRNARIKTDILDLCARLSIDIITGYLLGKRYGGLSENKHLTPEERQSDWAKLSANPWVHAVVSWARFSLLPNGIFRLVYPIYQGLNASEQVTESFAKVDRFAQGVMETAATVKAAKAYYYHERLLQAGVSPVETTAQSQAIIFAGADSTAVMLVTILFHLIQNGAARIRLQCEIRSPPSNQGGMPFLRAVVKEGLRLGMANPTRLTRVVPKGPGFRVGNILLPPGTVVGCAAYNLHHDPDVFPDPFAFRPERWLDDGTDRGLRRPSMEKSMIPFGAGSRACIGKNLALYEMQETIMAIIDSEVLEGARTCQDRIELTEWFNGDIKGHRVDIDWT
ncbi:hypothetical protein DL770_009541 [Monosporascus sp. CRB-9-2]|nr:hypothetical protein DL770_009541 [Monosporascus sp. CRB-9-2]